MRCGDVQVALAVLLASGVGGYLFLENRYRDKGEGPEQKAETDDAV